MTETTENKNKPKKIIGLIWAAVGVFAIVLGILDDFHNVFKVINFLSALLSEMPLAANIVLIAIIVVAVAMLIYYANKNIKATKTAKAFFYAALFAALAILPQIIKQESERKFIIVYDDIEPIDTALIPNIETQKLENLFQLNSIGQLDNSIIISTVCSPEIKWAKEFPNNSVLNSPIFSIQEVIEPSKSDIIDISLLDFCNEIAKGIEQKVITNSEIRIFYEAQFQNAATKLKNTLTTKNTNIRVNTINYDEKGFKSLLSKDMTLVFLGSTYTFNNSISKLKTTDYKFLFAPNWIKPLTSNFAKKNSLQNRFCVSANVYDKLVSNDTKTWITVIKTIKEEVNNINSSTFPETVKSKIRSIFANNNQTNLITF